MGGREGKRTGKDGGGGGKGRVEGDMHVKEPLSSFPIVFRCDSEK